MPFNSNIPQPGDLLSQSQPQILANFQALNNIANNILTYGLFSFQSQAPTTSATQVALYSALNTNTANQELYYRPISNGTPVPLTASSITGTTPAWGQTGWCYLPCGLIMKWGVVTIVTGSNGVGTYTYPTGANIPAFATATINVQINNVYTSGDTSFTAKIINASSTGPLPSATGFSILSFAPTQPGFIPVAGNATISYLALGV